MTIFLVRHAHAGSRREWDGDNRVRPLSDKGWRQADRIAAALRAESLTRLVSSPSLRCLQTLQPLARALSFAIDSDERFYEGADTDGALRAIDELARTHAAVGSHGDVIPELIDALRQRGVPVNGRGCEKGSIWRLDVNRGAIVSAEYCGRP